MATKTINTRVKQRFATISEWMQVWTSFVPLKGEICKIQIPANAEVTGLVKSASKRVLTKTGDGTTTLFNLPWDSAIVANETVLSKGTDTTATKSLSHGGTFTAVTDTAVNNHQITDTTTTYTLPAETELSIDSATGTQLKPSHGGTFNVVTAVAKGDSSHNVDVTTTSVKLPSETSLSKGTDTTGTATTLSHGGKFSAITDTAVSGHKITDTVTEFTLPAETTLSKGTDTTGTATTLTHGGKFKAVTDTTVSGHKVTDVVTEFTLPSETAVVTDQLTGTAKTLTHGGTVDVITGVTKGNTSHNVDVTKTTLTLPAETTISVVESDRSSSNRPQSDTGQKLSFGSTFAFVDEIEASGHKITSHIVNYELPTETKLSKETDKTATATLTHGGTFTAVTDTSVSNHKITDTTTTYTLPAETALSVDQGTATSSKPAHGSTVTVVTGVTKGDSSHNLDIAKTTITFPSETRLSKATDATAATQTLSHGGTFTALTDLTVSNHAITDKPTTFTLPSETTLSVVDNESGNAVTDVTVSGHAITLKRGSNFLTAHPTISTSTDSTSTQTATHGGTISVVDSVTRDSNGHVTKINTKTVTLPQDTNTDTKVTHSRTTTSSYRPILLHSIYTEAGADPGAATDQVYYNESVSVCPSTGTIKATTFSGKATSATKLATARNISLGTAVTSTATSFNGTANITIPVTGVKEGYLDWGGKSISGGVTPVGMALSEEHSGNKAAFINGDAITVEYSTDGTTFTDAAIAKADKTALFTTNFSVPIGGNTAMTSSNYTKLKTRITLTAQDGTHGYIYTDVKKLLVNMSTAATTNMLIETMKGDSTTWETFGTYSVSGWSGWNDIPLITTLGGSSSQKDRPWKVRFTFSLASCNTSYSTTKSVTGFRIFGQNSWNVPSTLGKTGHLYDYDMSQNATFPAKVTATEFSGSGASLSNLSAGALTSGIVPRARFPYATTSGVGGVQIGSNISVSATGVISLTKSNVTTALGYTPPTTNTTYSVATASTAGLVKPVSVITKPTLNSVTTTSDKYYQVQMSSDGNMFVNVPWTNTTYTFNGAVSTIKDSNLTASRALISNSSGKVAVSTVTSTELGYLDGVTSAIQTQLNGKASSTHSHAWKTF